jgi:outer membrane protein OmpA-like peptidoglycan-associated protein
MSMLTETIQRMQTPQLISAMAARTGVPESKVRIGTNAATGAILEGLANHARDPRVMNDVVDLIDETQEVDDLSVLMDDGAPARRSGTRLLTLTTSDRSSMLDRLSASIGIGRSAMSNIMAVAAGLVMAGLRTVSRTRGGLDATALSTMLIDDSSAVRAAMPSDVIGLRDPSLNTRALHESDRYTFRKARGTDRRDNRWMWLLALIPMALIALWIFSRPSSRTEEPHSTAPLVRERSETDLRPTQPEARAPDIAPATTPEEATPPPATTTQQEPPVVAQPAPPTTEPPMTAPPAGTSAQTPGAMEDPYTAMERERAAAGEPATTTPTEPSTTTPTEPPVAAEPSKPATAGEPSTTTPTEPSKTAEPAKAGEEPSTMTPTEPPAAQPAEPAKAGEEPSTMTPTEPPAEPAEPAKAGEEPSTMTPTEPAKPAEPSKMSLDFPAGSAEAMLLSDATTKSDDATKKGEWLVLDAVKFATGSHDVSNEADEQLSHIAQILEQNPDVKLEIGGYTDAPGSARMNLQISQARADSVRKALIAKGVDGSRIKAKGYGEADPITDTKAADESNRRVAVRIATR